MKYEIKICREVKLRPHSESERPDKPVPLNHLFHDKNFINTDLNNPIRNIETVEREFNEVIQNKRFERQFRSDLFDGHRDPTWGIYQQQKRLN